MQVHIQCIYNMSTQLLFVLSLNNPYIVILDGSVANAQQTMKDLQLDAISLYAFGGSQSAAPFTLLNQQTNWWWNKYQEKNNCSIVTPIPIG